MNFDCAIGFELAPQIFSKDIFDSVIDTNKLYTLPIYKSIHYQHWQVIVDNIIALLVLDIDNIEGINS